jgi:bifunctional DNase/RNase
MDVDARTSDAIALAVKTGAPLFVHEDVLDEAARDVG